MLAARGEGAEAAEDRCEGLLTRKHVWESTTKKASNRYAQHSPHRCALKSQHYAQRPISTHSTRHTAAHSNLNTTQRRPTGMHSTRHTAAHSNLNTTHAVQPVRTALATPLRTQISTLRTASDQYAQHSPHRCALKSQRYTRRPISTHSTRHTAAHSNLDTTHSY